MPRDYKKERRDYYGYGKYSSVTPEQQKHRREMAGRKKAKKMVGKCKGEVHHKNHNAQDNRRSNLACISKSKNRSMNQKKYLSKVHVECQLRSTVEHH